MRKYLDTDKVYVYYFNEENQKLEKIAYELEIVDGFFQFYINHNSDYVMTSNKVDDIFVDEVSSKEIYENNQEKIDSSNAITTLFSYDEFIKSSNNKGFLLQTI